MEFVDYRTSARIADITLNRPDRLNAGGSEVRRDLGAALTQFAFDPRADVAILSGNGRAFCAGRDLKEEAVTGARTYGLKSYPDLFNRQLLIDTDKILIAAAHGFAIGLGFYYVLGCDYRIASEGTTFAMPEVDTGVLGPFDIGLYENVPWAVATEIALLGRRLDAHRLREVGMLNEVASTGSHLERAHEVAEEFLKLPRDVLRATKELMLLSRPSASRDVRVQATNRRRELWEHSSRVTAAKGFAERGSTC